MTADSKLTPARLELLRAVQRGDVVRMPDGRTWDVTRGVFRDGTDMSWLRADGLVVVVPAINPQMDRDYELTDEGQVALANTDEEN